MHDFRCVWEYNGALSNFVHTSSVFVKPLVRLPFLITQTKFYYKIFPTLNSAVEFTLGIYSKKK